jgi:hypothetical protein
MNFREGSEIVASVLHSPTETFRILLLRRDGSEILLSSTGAVFSLLEVAIPRCQRTAEHVNAEMKRRWNLDVISLFSPDFGSDAMEGSRLNYFAVESARPNARPPAGLFWTPVPTLTNTSFSNSQDFGAIRQFLADCNLGLQDKPTGPFGKPGWFREVSRWVQNEIDSLDLHLNGRFQQFNASPTFSLIRFETDRVAVWFKAVGEPNLREFPITLALAKLIPSYIPRLLASRRDWNAWLVREAEGSELFATADVDQWEMASQALASAQVESASKAEGLLALGARDARVTSLLQCIDPFFQASAEAMARQTKKAPAALKDSELRILKMEVKDALHELETTGFPNACGHLDLNPRNIIVAPGKCTFLDWAEATVGHPVLSCEYLLEHFRGAFPGNRDGQVRLTERYVAAWAALKPPCDMYAALAVAPLLAVFAYAATCTDWRDPRCFVQAERAAYLRSLTRRMKHEADRLTEARDPCRT